MPQTICIFLRNLILTGCIAYTMQSGAVRAINEKRHVETRLGVFEQQVTGLIIWRKGQLVACDDEAKRLLNLTEIDES